MAEFTEVWEQWTRMCGAHEDCSECPMRELGCNLEFPCNQTKYAPEVIEAIVMKWAEENPAKVYPTWCEWLLTNKIVKQDDEYGLWWVKEDPIPADIAEKLGLEPKEG